MTLLAISLTCFVATGLAAVVARRREAWALNVATAGAVGGCAVGLGAALPALVGATPPAIAALDWGLAYGPVVVGLDPLTAFFLAPLYVLGGCAALYARDYLAPHAAVVSPPTLEASTKSISTPSPPPPHHVHASALALGFNLLLASMVLVVIARDALIFLVAWEGMTLSSYLLVTAEHGQSDVRRAGWIYLVAAHIGLMCLLVLFLLLAGHSAAGDLSFAALEQAAAELGPLHTTVFGTTVRASTWLFALAVVGFGVKIGVTPFYVWLPGAHAAAPSHVSAVMSGVLIKTGLYGLLRVLGWLPVAPWWGPLLAALGMLGALLGIALALYQRDIKRVLAYSSVENIGICLLALGIGYWGAARAQPVIAAFGIAGALLHVWNHTLMKGVMFLGAGSIVHSTGTKDFEKLGGLLRRMPWTGAMLLLGATAIAGLPPLNGFVSEFLIYNGLLQGGLHLPGLDGLAASLLVGMLALVGGLAALTFARFVGIALLGTPRGPQARVAHEVTPAMLAPQALLLFGCVVIAVCPATVLRMTSGVVEQILGPDVALAFIEVVADAAPLTMLARCNVALWAVMLGIGWIVVRRFGTASGAVETWGCGYLAPSARMQYTARGFAEFFSGRLLPAALRPRLRRNVPTAFFPEPVAFACASADDPLLRGIYEPFFTRWAGRFARLRWMQQGVLSVYLLYILAVVVAALAWISWRGGGAG